MTIYAHIIHKRDPSLILLSKLFKIYSLYYLYIVTACSMRAVLSRVTYTSSSSPSSFSSFSSSRRFSLPWRAVFPSYGRKRVRGGTGGFPPQSPKFLFRKLERSVVFPTKASTKINSGGDEITKFYSIVILTVVLAYFFEPYINIEMQDHGSRLLWYYFTILQATIAARYTRF